jgi:exoribonuclease R
MSSASYCLADETDTGHFGIGTDVYCHASSPIRRYADLMNQRILKQIIRGTTEGLMVSVPVADLNARAKAVKQYEKKLVFLRELLGGSRTVTGRILDIVSEKAKLRVWIEAWQTTLSVRTEEYASFSEGEMIQLECAMNLLSRRWSEKLVVRVSKSASTDCQEAQCPAPADP